jgi:integrase/recombinase XerD
MRLSRWVSDYLAYKRALGYRLVSEVRILRRFCSHFDRFSPADIGPDRVLAFLHEGQVSQETVARKRRVLAGLYRYVRGRYGEVLPALPSLRVRPAPPFVPYIYSRDELSRLLRAAAGSCRHPRALIDNHTLRTMVLLLYGAGLRLGEALKLDRADVDLDRALITVRETKFFKTRLVPVGEDLAQVLIAYRRWRDKRHPCEVDSPFFCLRDSRRARHKIVERTFRRLCATAGISRTCGPRTQPRLHDLRHTAAVHRLLDWYRRGADLPRLLPGLATYLGHKDLSGTQRYLTLTPELLREASVRFEQYALESSHV